MSSQINLGYVEHPYHPATVSFQWKDNPDQHPTAPAVSVVAHPSISNLTRRDVRNLITWLAEHMNNDGSIMEDDRGQRWVKIG